MSPRGLALLQCIAGIGALTAMDALVKWLAQINPVELITLGRHASGTLIAIAVWQVQRRPAVNRAALPLHFARGAIITVSIRRGPQRRQIPFMKSERRSSRRSWR